MSNPYQPGQRVMCCYGVEASGRLTCRAVGRVHRVDRQSDGSWRIQVVGLPWRDGLVEYCVNDDGVDPGAFIYGWTGPLSPTGHRWIVAHDDGLTGVCG